PAAPKKYRYSSRAIDLTGAAPERYPPARALRLRWRRGPRLPVLPETPASSHARPRRHAAFRGVRIGRWEYRAMRATRRWRADARGRWTPSTSPDPPATPAARFSGSRYGWPAARCRTRCVRRTRPPGAHPPPPRRALQETAAERPDPGSPPAHRESGGPDDARGR